MSGSCILCGKCLSVCPLIKATNREELGPRAKADLCRLLEDGTIPLSEKNAGELASMCLGCRRCTNVCSQGVDVPGLVAALRSEHPGFKGWLWKTWLTNAAVLWSASSSAANHLPDSLKPERFGPFLKMLAGLKGESGLRPAVIPASFPDSYKGKKMLLFAGCTANYVQGRWLMAALRLLDGLGVEVIPGDFKCCGGSLKSAGFADEAASMQEHNLDVWRSAGKPDVVTFCTSCRAALRAYPCNDKAEQEEWGAAQHPLSELTREIEFSVSIDDSVRFGYHRPCHVGKADADGVLMRAALGSRLVVSGEEQCCGFGGVMHLAAPDVCSQVNTQCWDSFGETDVIVTGCAACAARLASSAPEGKRAGHWLELIGEPVI